MTRKTCNCGPTEECSQCPEPSIPEMLTLILHKIASLEASIASIKKKVVGT